MVKIAHGSAIMVTAELIGEPDDYAVSREFEDLYSKLTETHCLKNRFSSVVSSGSFR
jgi:hypothetical protein